MKKIPVLILILFCFAGKVSYGQTIAGSEKLNTVIRVLYNMDTTLAEVLKEDLLDFNTSKILDVKTNVTTQCITIFHTSMFNEVEILALLREKNLEGYIVRNGFAYRLNGMGTGLVETNYSPFED